jgi:hypothetical protein
VSIYSPGPGHSIPIGVPVDVDSGVVYATPAVLCTLVGTGLEFGTTFTGPWAAYAGLPVKLGFIRPGATTVVTAQKVNTFNKSSASYLGPYAQRVIADGASNYWRLGESSGLVAVDSVGGANGTISGGVTLGAAGAIADGNKAMTFDGTTGKIVTSVPIAWSVQFTVEVWIKGTTAAANYMPIFSNRGTVPTDAKVFIGVMLDKTLIFVSDNATPSQVFGVAQVVLDGQWHHIVAVGTATTVLLYIDSLLKRTEVTTLVAPTANLAAISYDFGTPGGWFNGQLDDVAIYPRALTAQEIAQHYALR